MRRFVLAATLLIGTTGAAFAQDGLPSKPGIEGTIQSQIDAFRADDFVEAFRFASPNIRSMFGDASNFGLMVRNGYPMVWRPDELRFLELREIAGSLWQKVMIRDLAGDIHILDYQMIETEEGWRINGVQILDSSEFAA